MAQEEGLEPPTKRLTAACSTDWATPELIGDKVEIWNYWNAKAMSSNPYFSARLSNWILAERSTSTTLVCTRNECIAHKDNTNEKNIKPIRIHQYLGNLLSLIRKSWQKISNLGYIKKIMRDAAKVLLDNQDSR